MVQGERVKTIGYAVPTPGAPFEVYKFESSKPLGPKDVHIQIKYAGICHTDIHMTKDEWGGLPFPMVPGHEIAGVIVECGNEVDKFKVGDHGAVGFMVSSCRECKACKTGAEQYCPKMVWTHGSKYPDGSITYGGYSRDIVVSQDYCVKVPTGYDLAPATSLACAGITVWSPMRHFKMDKPGYKLGVIGLGGLGHMAVKLGAALGCHVTVFSRSDAKKSLAMNELKANAYVNMSNAAEVEAAKGTIDGIIDTVAADKDMEVYISLLSIDGILVSVALPEMSYQMKCKPASLILTRRLLGGSLIGSIQEMQDLFDFCHKHKVYPMVEKINCDAIPNAYERVLKGDVLFRFVIDIEGSCPKLE